MSEPSPGRPLLIYDGDCGFCVRQVARWRARTLDRVLYVPASEVDAELGLAPEMFTEAVSWVDLDGTTCSGAEAVFRALAHAPGWTWLLWLWKRSGLFAQVASLIYTFVASHRAGLSRLYRLLMGRDLRPNTWVLTRWLFIRCLGLVTVGAALSYWVQVDALNGADGILPATQWLERVQSASVERGWSTLERLEVAPTLLWLSPGDGALHALLGGTVLGGLAMVLGFIPWLGALLALICYLSVVVVGGVFMHYQWDMLLLESLFVALFICPWSIGFRPRPERRPGGSGLWLGRLLFLKLMVLSGSVKILSEDPTWADLTALNYHYWTQPIPAWSSWFVHHLGEDFHRISVMGMYGCELALPFTMFAPRRLRLLGFWGMLVFVLGMGVTGNYGYFHLLTACLLLLLVDDQHLRGLTPSWLRSFIPDPHAHAPSARPTWRAWARIPVWVLAAYVAAMSLGQMAQRYDRSLEMPGWVQAGLEPASSLRLVNGYGLFATMTTTRPEVILEGSVDGEIWEPYIFPYKAGALEESPSFAPPLHMPRVDWQLWFAALRGRCQNTRWFLPFAQKLLEGSPDVHGVLAHNPFPEAPPRHLRSRLFHYRFSTPDEREETGDWWRREEVGVFCPTLMLRGDQLVRSSTGQE